MITRPIKIAAAFVALAALVKPAPPAEACTTFAVERGKQLVVGKSYDWHTGDGLLIVNPRGLAKQALLDPSSKLTPARWLARHGSVTFNQYGRELPLGGINERGLVVEIMWLTEADYGKPQRGRPTVNELQLIQYLLDTAATIDEAIAAVRRLQVAKVYAAVHYLACDRTGACASIEHLGGKPQIHRGAALPARVLTNDTYRRSLAHLRRHAGFGGARAVKPGTASLDRFARAATLARRGGAAVGPAREPLARVGYGLLLRVQIGSYTKWQIVYEPRRGLVHFRNRGDARPLTIDTGKLSFGCGAPVRIMDVKGTVLGARGRWATYGRRHNHKLLRLSLARLGAAFPEAAIQQLAAYPEQATRCVKPGR